MEAPQHIVGCVLAARPAADLIDAFVAQARRERAVVMAKSAQAATFVRFAAADARLVAAACRAVRGQAPGVLRFGLVAGVRDQATVGAAGATPADAADEGGLNISTRSIVLANDLAAGAGDGEVLVSPPLAMWLLEAGFVISSRQVRLPGGRSVAACALDVGEPVAPRQVPAQAPGAAGAAAQAAQGATLLRNSESLADVLRLLLAQAGEMAAKQDQLEARQDAVLGKMTLLDQGHMAARHLADMEAELGTQIARVEARLGSVDQLEQRLAQAQAALGQLEQGLSEQLSRRGEIDGLKSQTDALARGAADALRQLDSVASLQQRLLPMVEQVAALTRALDGVDEKIAAIESRRRLVEEVQSRADAIAHLAADMQLHMELLNEQRSVTDHVGEHLAKLDFTVREAQSTLRALQREREVGERVSQGLRALRSRSSGEPSTQ